jgi:hypothetical protein
MAPGGPLALKSEQEPPATLGGSAAADVRLIVWCRDCSHQVEPDPAEMSARYGGEDDGYRLARAVGLFPLRRRGADIVVTGTKRRRE